MLLAALSLWTAIPLSWIYIGSKLSQTQFPSGGPYAVVAVGIVVSILVVAWLIGRLNRLYVRDHRHQPPGADAAAWLKSMRDTSAPVGTDDRRRGGADGLGRCSPRLALDASGSSSLAGLARFAETSSREAGVRRSDDELAVFLQRPRRRPRSCRRGAGRRPCRCGRRTR